MKFDMSSHKPQSKKLAILIYIYVVLISTWFISWLTIGDDNWWLTLLNRIVPYLFIPVPLFMMWIIFSRRLKLLIPLLIPTLIFTGIYHPYLFPRQAQSAKAGSVLSVMTYNVLYSNLDYDAVAKIILDYHPDLMALQEVQPPMMSALKEYLANDYPYSILGGENPYGTTAVFSRHPLTDAYILDLKADRPAVIVKTKISDKEITFISTHLLAYGLLWVKLRDIPEVVGERTAGQNRQVNILLDRVKGNDGMVVVGCDCNSYETSSSYRIFAQSMDNTARQLGLRVGDSQFIHVNQNTSLQHIDNLWYRGPLEPVAVYTVTDSGGSDHFPVLAVFRFE